jgi:hypothetical protein
MVFWGVERLETVRMDGSLLLDVNKDINRNKVSVQRKTCCTLRRSVFME